jgi:hypothetical protein
MDQRDRDQYARLDAVDDLIVDLQREMLSGAQRQARELDEVRRSIELAKMEPPKGASAETKAKVIGVAVSAALVGLINAAIQNDWFAEPKTKDPGELPIPASTYQ